MTGDLVNLVIAVAAMLTTFFLLAATGFVVSKAHDRTRHKAFVASTKEDVLLLSVEELADCVFDRRLDLEAVTKRARNKRILAFMTPQSATAVVRCPSTVIRRMG
jgi:hypothetical protein